MNDIERLGEIKEQFEYGIKHQFEDYNVALSDIDLLIEQAERVQELEEENFALMESLRFQDEILERQNKRYREALKWCAGFYDSEIARQALRGETDEC